MRWYQANSEQLEPITNALMEWRKRLETSIDSARKAGLIRAYDMETANMRIVTEALNALGDIRRTED